MQTACYGVKSISLLEQLVADRVWQKMLPVRKMLQKQGGVPHVLPKQLARGTQSLRGLMGCLLYVHHCPLLCMSTGLCCTPVTSVQKHQCSTLSRDPEVLGCLCTWGHTLLWYPAWQLQSGDFSVLWKCNWQLCCEGWAQLCTWTGNLISFVMYEKCSLPSTDLQFLVLTGRMNLQRIWKPIF